MSAFEELGVCPEIIRVVEDNEWLLPTPVQQDAIPYILGGGDVCVAAETGSGKTAAFGIPCLQLVSEGLRKKALTMNSTGSVGMSSPITMNFDPNDKDPYVLILPDNGMRSGEAKRWNGIRATVQVMKGTYVYEVELQSPGLVRVGWSLSGANLNLGTDDRGFGYGGTAKKSWNNTFENYGETFGNRDVISCLIDRNNQTVQFAKNGTLFETAFNIPPGLHQSGLKPHICGKEFDLVCRFNDLRHTFKGFQPLGTIHASHTEKGVVAELETAGRTERHPLCIILEPTRDLAKQTYEFMTEFGVHLENPKPRIALLVGGDERSEFQSLQQGTDICVGTLFKIISLVKRNTLDTSHVKYLVLDEADDLIKNDQKYDIPFLKKSCEGRYRKVNSVQTMFFSATLHSDEVKRAIGSLTNQATWIDLKGKPTIPDTVHFIAYRVDPSAPDRGVHVDSRPGVELPPTDLVHEQDRENHGQLANSQRIKLMKPQVVVRVADALKMESCLVFCRTNVDCDNLEKYLTTMGGGRKFTGQAMAGKENPYSCVVLAGMRAQEERERNLNHFKNGDVRFLICTDVAARGIDIKGLPYLIMTTLPDETDQFFHRVGRTGRADRMGLAICIVSSKQEKVWFHANCTDKRDRGKSCRKTHLKEQGGCCVWWDEPKYLKDIEDVIKTTIPIMDPYDFSVPGILNPMGIMLEKQEKLGRRAIKATDIPIAGEAGGMVVYGKQQKDETSVTISAHSTEITSYVNGLTDLEKDIQNSYLTICGQ